jgi:hypothetical protein
MTSVSRGTSPDHSTGHDLEAHAECDADLRWVERDEADRLGESVGGCEVHRIGQPDGL